MNIILKPDANLGAGWRFAWHDVAAERIALSGAHSHESERSKGQSDAWRNCILPTTSCLAGYLPHGIALDTGARHDNGMTEGRSPRHSSLPEMFSLYTPIICNIRSIQRDSPRLTTVCSDHLLTGPGIPRSQQGQGLRHRTRLSA